MLVYGDDKIEIVDAKTPADAQKKSKLKTVTAIYWDDKGKDLAHIFYGADKNQLKQINNKVAKLLKAKKINEGENKMSNENIVQKIIDETNSQKEKNPRIYKLQWASGHQNIVSLNEAIEVVNRWANQKDWQWIKVINTETNKQQVIYESATRIGRKLNTLDEDLMAE